MTSERECQPQNKTTPNKRGLTTNSSIFTFYQNKPLSGEIVIKVKKQVMEKPILLKIKNGEMLKQGWDFYKLCQNCSSIQC